MWWSVYTVGVSTDGHGRATLAACPAWRAPPSRACIPVYARPAARTLPRSVRAGRAAALMTCAVRESVTLAGRAERARVARAFVDGVLGPGHRCGDVAAPLVEELFVNSILHSGSGAPARRSRSRLKIGDDVLRVEVTDLSGPGVPEPRRARSDAEDGRGLHLVAHLAARWGWRRRGGRTVTWFEMKGRLNYSRQPDLALVFSGPWLSGTEGARTRSGRRRPETCFAVRIRWSARN